VCIESYWFELPSFRFITSNFARGVPSIEGLLVVTLVSG
jgi:hypothetical protein